MQAGSWLDLICGLDVHMQMVPMPAPVPTPFPHPFVGMSFDPRGRLVGEMVGAAIKLAKGDDATPKQVMINVAPATITGDDATNKFSLPHFVIPPGTMWAPLPKQPKPPTDPKAKPEPPELPLPPPGDAWMLMGAKTVEMMGAPAVRMGEIAMGCSDPVRMPTSTVIAIPKGPPVSIGGPSALSIASAVGKAVGVALKKFGPAMRTRWESSRLSTAVSRMKPARLRGAFDRMRSRFTGHPVNVATGAVLTERVEFEYPGAIPLKFERIYQSNWCGRSSALGHGWSHSLDQSIWLEPGKAVLLTEDGRELEFDAMDRPGHTFAKGDNCDHPFDRLTLRCRGQFVWTVESPDGTVREFAPIPGESGPNRDRGLARLVRIRGRDDNAITLQYDGSARLAQVRDTRGRVVKFDHDAVGRLTKIWTPAAAADGWGQHAEFKYSPQGDLIEVKDAAGNAFTYEYAGHLLVKETNRRGTSFYFTYDVPGARARCTRTWGDDGIFDHVIDYDVQNRTSVVTDSLERVTSYQMNAVGAIETITAPGGGVTKFTYDEQQRVVEEIDAEGGSTKYSFDERGNMIMVIQPDRATTKIRYDERNQPVEALDPMGGRWEWTWDTWGRMATRLDPTGRRVTYGYEGGQLHSVTDAMGNQTRLQYDDRGHLSAMCNPDGSEVRFSFDRLGRLTSYTDPRGAVWQRHYDGMGRVVRTNDRDGNVRELSYDAEGNVSKVRDRVRDIVYEYTAMGRMKSRSEGGTTVEFDYDTEENLVAVRNQAGSQWTYERDAAGNITAEVDYDGRRRVYVRDQLGRAVQIMRPGGHYADYAFDPMGRLLGVEHSDGTQETYAYREDGELAEADNGAVKVVFERDAMGNVTKEIQGDHWVESAYDHAERRVAVDTSLELHAAVTRDVAGYVEKVSVGQGTMPWAAIFKRDPVGAELERHLPGGVVGRFMRDRVGRPSQHMVIGPRKGIRDAKYRWEVGHRLVETTDGRGPRRHNYDLVGNLVAVAWPEDHLELRVADRVGNLFRSKEANDRAYGPSGELLSGEGISYAYDDEGNLIEKTDAEGGKWTYAYSAAGRLSEVVRPDGKTVAFKYDALGRRVEKTFDGTTTRFVWDGDVVVHEVVDGKPATTWIFAPGTFAPLCKAVGDQRFGIVSDDMGVPIAMFDTDGNAVWTAEIDAWGDVVDHTGERSAVPFRFPGQYEDEETGLYYNRYRYYDPKAGIYIRPDPLRMTAGLKLYAYVHDPLTWVDPLGLSCQPKAGEGPAADGPPSAAPTQSATEASDSVRTGDAGPNATQSPQRTRDGGDTPADGTAAAAKPGDWHPRSIAKDTGKGVVQSAVLSESPLGHVTKNKLSDDGITPLGKPS